LLNAISYDMLFHYEGDLDYMQTTTGKYSLIPLVNGQLVIVMR